MDMGYIFIFKYSYYMGNGVYLTNVSQKLIA